jgi:hypothetical protein
MFYLMSMNSTHLPSCLIVHEPESLAFILPGYIYPMGMNYELMQMQYICYAHG